MTRTAAIDLGSGYCGIASAAEGLTEIRAHEVRALGDDDATAVAIVDWISDDGSSAVVFEWARFHPGQTPQATMAMAGHRRAMERIMDRVVALCRARGIAVADNDTLNACRGPGLISVQSWRSRVGVVVTTRDPDTKKPVGGWDRYVKHALVGRLGAALVDTVLTSTHKRDAAGALLGYMMGGPARSGAGKRRSRREYTEHRASLASARGRRFRGRQAEARRLARLALPAGEVRPCGCRRRYRHARGCAGGLTARAALEAAGGQLRAGALARALGIRETSLPLRVAVEVRTGLIVRPERGVYAIGKIVPEANRCA